MTIKMEIPVVFVYISVYFVLQSQLTLAVYSNSCNKTALIIQDKELGIRGSKIPDNRFHASSAADDAHKPWRGRLDQQASGNQASSWCAKFKDKKQWFLIDLVDISEVTDIATQGQYDPVNTTSNFSISWVTQYRVDYSSDNKSYYSIEYKYERPLIFKGNSDGNSVVCNKFPYSVKAQYIRVHPLAWNRDICLRVGLFGRVIGGNATAPFFTPSDRPDHETWWWWIFFWAVLAFLLLIMSLGFLIYCCIIRRRTFPQEKVIKEKPVRVPTQRNTDSYGNDAYGMRMSVMTVNTSLPDTPQDVEDAGDEIQEVTAEFTDDEGNQRGIVGFSVTDDSKGESDEETANGDVNWEHYKQRAMSKRSLHLYENVDLKTKPQGQTN